MELVNEYWRFHIRDRELPLLRVPCKDCACENGFYTNFADELLKESIEVQDKVLSTWFCHNNVNGACRGAYNHVHRNRE